MNNITKEKLKPGNLDEYSSFVNLNILENKFLRNKFGNLNIKNLNNLLNNSKSIILILFALTFILCISSAETVHADEIIGNSSSDYSINGTDENDTNSSTNSTITLNKSEITYSGKVVANYIERNKKLPNTISIGAKVITINQYLYAITSFISGSDNVTLFGVSSKIYAVSRFSTSYTQSQYQDMAKRTLNYIQKYHKAPSYVSSAHGNVDYYNLIYLLSKITRYYENYGKMPSKVSLVSQIPTTARLLSSSNVDKKIKSLSTQLKSTKKSISALIALMKKTKSTTTLKKFQTQYITLKLKYSKIYSNLKHYKQLRSSSWYIPSKMRKYLKETKYCQITNGNIVYVAMNLRGSNPYETGNNIFNWLRDNIDYSFYYRTKYSAKNTLKYRLGNCADQAHLIVAMARTSGLPARYVRGTCKFVISGHVYSHVWAQIWIKGRGWVTADTSSYLNSFGVIRSWNPKKSSISGTLIQYSL